MSIVNLLAEFLLFFGLVFGLGLPLVVTAPFAPAERLALGAATGMAVIGGAAWLVYLAGVPPTVLVVLPALAALGLAVRHRPLASLAALPEIRSLAGRQLVFAAWCVGLLALIRSYGGGEWAGDWLEHYDRARFFLNHDPLNTLFLGVYDVPARPPLANLVDACGLALTRADYAHFQLFNTLCGSLVFLPAVLLARHFAPGRSRVDAVMLLGLMFNPLVVQNATFAWTKLLTAFYVLLAVVLYLRGLGDAGPARRVLAATILALALLVHYSAGPYLVGAAAFQAVWLWRRRSRPGWWREFAWQAGLIAAVLAPWFAWSAIQYGLHATFLSNTTATADAGLSVAARIARRFSNAFVTLVPHPLRPADYRFIAQISRLGFIRDYLFNIYQTTLPGAFGAAGLALLAWRVRHRAAPTATADERRFWWAFVACVLVLGIATVSWPDRWGVVHICLIPLVVMGLAWLNSQVGAAPTGVRRVWFGLLWVDGLAGIALHFYLQATVRLRPGLYQDLTQGRVLEWSRTTIKNLLLKVVTRQSFVADGGPPPALVVALLVALAGLAIRQAAAGRPPEESAGRSP